MSMFLSPRPWKMSAALCAISLGCSLSAASFAQSYSYVNVTPGGNITISGSVTLHLTNSPTFQNQAQAASCTLTINGSLDPNTGNITVTSASLGNSCGSSGAHFYIDPAKLPTVLAVSGVGGGVIYESNIPIDVAPWVSFSPPPRPVACSSTPPNLVWLANIRSPTPSNQINTSGGVSFVPNASDGGSCTMSGTLYSNNAQTFRSAPST